MTVNTITATLTTQVTPNNGNYGPDLTIEASGAILIPIKGGPELQKALYIPSTGSQDTIVNFGIISSQTSFQTHGGVAIWSNADATFDNYGFIEGTYIAAFMVRGGDITNFGSVYSSEFGALLLNGGSFSNSGVVQSARYGAVLHEAEMLNNGTVIAPDVGISLYNQSRLINTGSIISGSTGVGISASGYLSNSGLIWGKTYAVLASGSFDLMVESGAIMDGKVEDLSNSGQLTLGGNKRGELKMDGSFAGFDEYSFGGAAKWTLEGNLDELATDETINGFSSGDTIILEDFLATGSFYIPDLGIVLTEGTINETIHLAGGLAVQDDSVTTGQNGDTYITAPCFRSGTQITTISGKVPIEELKMGDVVKTLHGKWSRIKWIGRRAYNGRFLSQNDFILPICIRRSALAENIPSRDLFLSPDHAVCEGGMLINAWRLINGTSIIQLPHAETVVYFHIELDRHDIIYAEDCPTESFLDENCRARFENSSEFFDLYNPSIANPTPCLPRLTHGMHLYLIQSRIRARAGISRDNREVGVLRGCIDEVGPNIVRGWAQDISNPEEPVLLSISYSGKQQTMVLANLYRPDLRKAGLGSGCHGFECVLGANLIPTTIEVSRIQDGALIHPPKNFLFSNSIVSNNGNR